jgi:ATP-dependent Clp protease ATP-binding subunit ClpA
LIAFTSNLGIYGTNDKGKRVQLVKYNESYQDMSATIRSAINDFFTFGINRPEILNRMGENFAIFDFIRPDAGRKIYEMNIASIIKNTYLNSGITLKITTKALDSLWLQICPNDVNKWNHLNNGGRGIKNCLEKCLINPLATYMFENNIVSGSINIKDIKFGQDLEVPTLICESRS